MRRRICGNKHQSKVQTFEILNSLSLFILHPFALILSRNLSFIPFYPLSFCLYPFTDPLLSFILSPLSFRENLSLILSLRPHLCEKLILYPLSFILKNLLVRDGPYS